MGTSRSNNVPQKITFTLNVKNTVEMWSSDSIPQISGGMFSSVVTSRGRPCSISLVPAALTVTYSRCCLASSGFAAPGDRPLFDTDAWSRRRGRLFIAPSVCSRKSASEGTGREPRIFRRKRGVDVYEFHKVLKFEVDVTRFGFGFITSVHPGRMNQQQTLCEPAVWCCSLLLNGIVWRKVQEGR